MKNQKGIVVLIIIVLLIVVGVRFYKSSIVRTSTLNWKTYELKGKLDTVSLKYPQGFNAGGATGLGGGGFQIEVKNFEWNKDKYGFPDGVKTASPDKFYMQVWSRDNSKNLSLEDWIKKNIVSEYNSPERVQIIGEYKNEYGKLVKQEQKTIDNKPAIQRTVSYPTKNGTIEITYTYVNEGNTIFQFIDNNDTDNNLKIYDQIVSSFSFTK